MENPLGFARDWKLVSNRGFDRRCHKNIQHDVALRFQSILIGREIAWARDHEERSFLAMAWSPVFDRARQFSQT
jgi:hypothetical protein